MRSFNTDILVVGSGIAGLYAAICCRQAGLRVTVCSKSKPGIGSCSALSQGHFRSTTRRFSKTEHRRLTLEAGQGLNREAMVDILVDRAQTDILRLKDFGVGLGERVRSFASTPEKIGQEGRSITKPLADWADSLGVQFCFPFLAWQVVELEGRAAGICGFFHAEAEPSLILARTVILAAGGCGALYRWSDNPQGMTGDGYAMAYRAGLPLMDMEFMQFFPLMLAGSSRTSRLIPPVVAEIGTLRNVRRENVVEKYAITRRPLAVAARDQLSLAMARDLEAGLGIQGAFEFEVPEDMAVWRKAGEAFGFDDTIEQIRSWIFKIQQESGSLLVRPGAHFCMGGVIIDECCRTRLNGLLAAGEIVGGLHGANRYGGNALTETVVFARIAAVQAVQSMEDATPDLSGQEDAARQWVQSHLSASLLEQSKAPQDQPSGLSAIRESLQELMWERAGLIRSEQGLQWAESAIEGFRQDLSTVQPGAGNLFQYCENRNRLLTAEMIVKSARMRRESRGAHFREDFPETDPDWTGHIRVQKKKQGMELAFVY